MKTYEIKAVAVMQAGMKTKKTGVQYLYHEINGAWLVGTEEEITAELVRLEELASSAKKVQKAKKGAPKKSDCPAGVRYAAWNWLVKKLSGKEIKEIGLRQSGKVTNLMVDGEKVWYSYSAEAAQATAEGLALKFQAALA